MKTIYYYYVRHGETIFNLENRMQGITDSPLTSKGIEQILQTTEALRNQSFNSAYTSPLPRTIQTAKLILEPHHMHAKIFDPLREFSYGSWDGNIKNESDPEYQYRFSNDLFDDLEALKAFDSQVDNATKTLGDKMVSAFSIYLATAKSAISNTYSELVNIKAAGDAVENEFPTNIYYKPKANKKVDPIYYQTVEASISISSTIKDVDKFIGDIEQDYSNTVRTIVSTSGDLSSLKTQLRTYLEEAIYNYATLSDVVKGQKAIGLIMKRISLQAKDFAELLNSNRGKSIEALDGRMQEMGTMATNISTLVEKCFGSNG